MKIQNFLSRTILCAVSLANVPFSAGCHAVVSATDKAVGTSKATSLAANRVLKGSVAIRFSLAKSSYVTLVIEDAAGQRVRNLIAETKLPAGENLVVWDGYDDGIRNETGDLVRSRVKPGRYVLRGLTHDGIHLRYEFPLYSGGNPPWKTPDKSGGWMADHSAPMSALFLPAGTSPFGDGKAQILLSSLIAEAGDPLILVDKTGRRIYGEHFFGWDGGISLARDVGQKGRKDYFAYALGGWEDSVALRVLNGQKSSATIASYKVENRMQREPGTIGLSLAVYNNLAVISLPTDNKLLFIDTQTSQILGTSPLSKPRGVYFDEKGNLFAISAAQIKRFQIRRTGDKVALADEIVFTKSNLVQPHSMTGDSAGNLYVADWGKSHQVKVFDSSGRLVRTIGKPGGLQVGLYDEQRMQNPQGLTLDDQGRLWVAEADHLPKRISVWNSDGQFAFAKYGPPRYGGGGTIDAQNPNRAFYADYGGIIEFELDWKTGISKPKAIVSRTDVQGFDPLPGENWLPDFPLHIGGRLYLVGMYQGGLRGNANTATFLVDEKTHVGRPVAYVGSDRWWPYVAKREDIKKLAPGGKNEQFMAWSDLNSDGKVQPNEFSFRVLEETFTGEKGEVRPTYGYREFFTHPDLSLTGVWSLHVPAPNIRPDGVPIYDLAQAKFLMPPGDPKPYGEDGPLAFSSPDGWLLTGDSGYKNGKRIWSYPTQYGSPLPTQPGQMIDPTRLLGPAVTMPTGKAGAIYAINGEKGNIYLMTSDGLFIQQLGGDMRVKPLLRLPKATRGMLVDGYSFEDEHFHPTMNLTKDGRLLLVAGKEHSSIFQVEGFDTVERRNFATLQLDEASLSKLALTKTEKARNQKRQTLAVNMVDKAPVIDGQLNDWPTGTSWARIDENASAAVAVSATHLIAAWKTNDPDLLTNDGGDKRFLFKKGGALDIMLGTDDKADAERQNPVAGDLRLLMTRVAGKPKAVLYRAVVAGTSPAAKILFDSPVGRVYFDEVKDVAAQLQLAQKGGNYEISIPLRVLDFQPHEDQIVHGDIGILRGDGQQTIQRVYWNNLDTTIVSDVPSEARLQPGNWGEWKLGNAVTARNSMEVGAKEAQMQGASLQRKQSGTGPDAEYSIGFWDKADQYLAWDLTVKQSGRYKVWLSYGNGAGGSDFTLTAGEQKLTGKTINTGGWDVYARTLLGTVSLNAGATKLKLAPTPDLQGGLMNFKSLRFVPAP